MTISKKTLLATLSTLAILILIITGYKLRVFEPSGISIGSRAPSFTEQTLSGETLHLEDFRGQYVLLDFWGTWCGPCRSETPNLKAAYAQFYPLVQFIGVPVNDNPEQVRQYIQQNDMRWPQLRVQRSGFRGTNIPWDYGINSYPTLLLIDPNGQIVESSHDNPLALRGSRLIKTLSAHLD